MFAFWLQLWDAEIGLQPIWCIHSAALGASSINVRDNIENICHATLEDLLHNVMSLYRLEAFVVAQWFDDPAAVAIALEDGRLDLVLPVVLELHEAERALRRHRFYSADGASVRSCAQIGAGNVLYVTGAGGMFYMQV